MSAESQGVLIDMFKQVFVVGTNICYVQAVSNKLVLRANRFKKYAMWSRRSIMGFVIW